MTHQLGGPGWEEAGTECADPPKVPRGEVEGRQRERSSEAGPVKFKEDLRRRPPGSHS